METGGSINEDPSPTLKFWRSLPLKNENPSFSFLASKSPRRKQTWVYGFEITALATYRAAFDLIERVPALKESVVKSAA